jgi:hypothetical protein
VSPLGKIAGKIWLPDTDEDYILIAQQTRSVDDHQLGGGIFEFGHHFLS